jgi:hypothetical protein
MGLFTSYASTTEARFSPPSPRLVVAAAVALFVLILSFGFTHAQHSRAAAASFSPRCASSFFDPSRCDQLLDDNGDDCLTYATTSSRHGGTEPFDADTFYACTLLSQKVWLPLHAAEAQRAAQQRRPPRDVLDTIDLRATLGR